MAYEVKILADSIAQGVRLTTVQATYPRIIHSEVMTHRMLSRNAASSRAIPVEKNIERVIADPFIPEAFMANKKGMQAGIELVEQDQARFAWIRAQSEAVESARRLSNIGVHKHWANRLLEPYSWITTVITATEWENFFALRCHPAAAPEFQKIAGMIRDAMTGSTPEALASGAWHLPLVFHDDLGESAQTLVKLSVARCARVSYLTHDGKRNVDADLALYERLLTSGHMSPMEHAARVGDPKREGHYPFANGHDGMFCGNFRAPWLQHRKLIAGEAVFRG